MYLKLIIAEKTTFYAPKMKRSQPQLTVLSGDPNHIDMDIATQNYQRRGCVGQAQVVYIWPGCSTRTAAEY